jgi:inorganic pyrophosphatase
MLLWDVSSFPGVVAQCRALGVLQIEQNRNNFDASTRIRNDRIMALPVEARRQREITTLADLSSRVRDELEQFATTATLLEGKDVRVLGWDDPAAALSLVQEGATRWAAAEDTAAVRRCDE